MASLPCRMSCLRLFGTTSPLPPVPGLCSALYRGGVKKGFTGVKGREARDCERAGAGDETSLSFSSVVAEKLSEVLWAPTCVSVLFVRPQPRGFSNRFSDAEVFGRAQRQNHVGERRRSRLGRCFYV